MLPTITLSVTTAPVDAPWHGKGIAHALMDASLDEAAHRGAATVWLGVWERNARAIRFYGKRGFHDIGVQPFKLGSDLQHDRVHRVVEAKLALRGVGGIEKVARVHE